MPAGFTPANEAALNQALLTALVVRAGGRVEVSWQELQQNIRGGDAHLHVETPTDDLVVLTTRKRF